MELYEAILARRSVRRFEQTTLDPAMQAQVRNIVDAVLPMVDGNRFEVLYRDVSPGENLVQALGAYGRIVTPPHYLVPFLLPADRGSKVLDLTDLGYRVQQIAVRLTQQGFGSCYVGCLPREDAARSYFGLPDGSRVGASLVYGFPSARVGDRLINTTIRRAVGAARKLPPEQLFFLDTFERPSLPPSGLLPLIEAARAAPSADNAQPWRFLRREGRLYLYLKRKSLRYELGGTQNYRWYDGGLCMANVSLAIEALGLEGHWSLVDAHGDTIPVCPDELQPLAVLELVDR